MARRIVEEGFPLTIWARRLQTVEPFNDTSATVVSSPAEVGAQSEIVGICVFSDDDVRDVLVGSGGVLAGMSPGGLVAIHSTVHPRTCAEVAEHAADRGIAVIDAPVSGGGAAAAARKLLVMTGGDELDVNRCRPVFDTFADPVVHVGPLGAGQMAKVMNNLLLAANLAVAIDVFALAAELRIDLSGLGEVLVHGSGSSKAAAMVVASGFNYDELRRGTSPYFTKDIGILLDIAEGSGVAEPESLVAVARRALPDLPG